VRVCGTRTGICVSVTPTDLDRLRGLVKDRNAPQKHVWRAQIVLLTVEGVGTSAIMRETGKAKTCAGRTMTHDYKRHGTTCLFTALNVLDGTVIGRNMQRHLKVIAQQSSGHQEFIRFLNAVEREVPVGKTVHAVLDNTPPTSTPPCGNPLVDFASQLKTLSQGRRGP
jgi:hypothetical protein